MPAKHEVSPLSEARIAIEDHMLDPIREEIGGRKPDLKHLRARFEAFDDYRNIVDLHYRSANPYTQKGKDWWRDLHVQKAFKVEERVARDEQYKREHEKIDQLAGAYRNIAWRSLCGFVNPNASKYEQAHAEATHITATLLDNLKRAIPEDYWPAKKKRKKRS